MRAALFVSLRALRSSARIHKNLPFSLRFLSAPASPPSSEALNLLKDSPPAVASPGAPPAHPSPLLPAAEPPPAAAASPPASKGPVSWASLALTAAALLGVVVYYRTMRARQLVAAQTRVESVGTPLLGGPFSLVDAAGRPFTSGDLLGRYVLLYFGFTYCPDICPSELQKMAAVVRALEKKPALRGRVAPVFISVDPARDTCEQVGAYCKDFHPDLIGLTGTPGQVAAAAKAFRVYFSEVDRKEGDDEADYLGAWDSPPHLIPTLLLGSRRPPPPPPSRTRSPPAQSSR